MSEKSRNMDSGEPFYDSSCQPIESKYVNQFNVWVFQEKKEEITSCEQKEEITFELR